MEIFESTKSIEASRRATALRLCKDANMGLSIRVYGEVTEYYMDPNRRGGHIHEENYAGVDDLRDKDHFV